MKRNASIAVVVLSVIVATLISARSKTGTLSWEYPSGISNITFNVYETTNCFVTNVAPTFDEASMQSTNQSDWIFLGMKTNVSEVWKSWRLLATTTNKFFTIEFTNSFRFFKVTASNTATHIESK